MFQQLKECLDDFLKNIKLYVTFELMYMIITSFIWVPVITFIFKSTLRMMGSPSLLNKEVFKMPLNIKGSLGLLAIFFLVILIVFIEIGVLIVLTQKNRFKTKVTVIGALLFVIKRIPKLFGIDILQGLVFLLLLLPVIETPISRLLTRHLNLEMLYYNKVQDSWLKLIIYIIIALALLYLVLRSIFTLHFIIIEGKTSGKAIRASLRLTKRNQMRLVVFMAITNALMLTIGILAISGMDHMIKGILEKFNSELLGSYILFLSSYLSYLVVIMITPINVIFITRLFYYMKNKKTVSVDLLVIPENTTISKLETAIKNYFETRRYLMLLVVVVYITGTFMLNYSFSEELFNWNVRVVAHRGYRSEPENSLPSIEKAIKEGVKFIELDVQITQDGMLVLNHDNTFMRVAGVDKNVWDMPYSQVRGLNLGYSTSTPNQIVRVPTLNQVFSKFGDKVDYLIDIKGVGPYTETVEQLVFLIEKYELVEHVYVQAFSRSALGALRTENPDIMIGQILYAAAGNLSVLDVDFFTINQNMVSENFIKQAHLANREVWVWTVNTEKNIRQVLEFEIDGIISDYPEKVQVLMTE